MNKFFRKNLISRNNKGFSIVELAITMFAFGILVTLVGGIFVFVIRTQGKSLNAQKLQENANFVLETMGREIRVANCISNDPICKDPLLRIADAPCSAPITSLTFQHPVNGTVIYALNGQVINRTIGLQTGQLTSNDVQVTRLGFCVKNNFDDDDRQPRVVVLLGLRAGTGKDIVEMDIQTTLSPRFAKD